ncbi:MULTISPECIES: ribosome small subunit-dependent GTPase A [Pseudobutyrivibrio]|uniref:Small ribosomal subunit biogenesis GTPase RsgA n=1 Tax=Pseudobutyrivibrio xylanivorans TaxID=185007 RepID=A0A1G5RRJ9_PSEXY|nr:MULTISPECIES: ribosome small subunit-dependent GTPase A [Pseudobutyrivibrio]MDC7279809.1 ribosome small subunit-dependent GTPase A [Butyrivibrio fibrisolvens]SCZ76725.1 ribosome biogenesis GTPase [Pseudobutyrivibrio xylanivorans]
MTGKIIKGIAGFYYVQAESGVYECKAKGAFRKDKIKPLVGDDVEIDVISEEEMTGNVISILPRKSELIRPAVANVDQALLIFATKSPEPNLNLLDRFLCMMEEQELPIIICFNKDDLADEGFQQQMRETYEPAGYKVIFTSAKEEAGIDAIKEILKGKTSTVAGPSGVGKSSIVNILTEGQVMETGEVSEKIGRGKHTTRHSELLYLGDDTYIMDTPGFSSLFVPKVEPVDLYRLFPEFIEPAENCRFTGCAHHKEPDCGVKAAVESGEIAASRYENYLQIYSEMVEQQNNKYR